MPPKSLKQKAVSGMIWTALQRYSTMLIQFISGIILARLLTPYDYGCIGMLMIFVILAEAFIDGGFGSALIQKKQPTQEDYSTIFFWNLGMAAVLYAVLYFSAPAIAGFYNIPLLCDVLRIQGVVLLIYAFNIVQRNQLRKKLNFKVLSIVTISTSLIALSVTIFMAYHGYGVWSLVTQHILTALIPALVFWFYIKWRPVFTFSWKSFWELFSFGFYMFLTNLINQFGQQIQGLLIGRFYNANTMGLYSKAHATERLASQSISQVLTQVTYPLYAELQDDKLRLGGVIKKLTITLSYFTFPLMFLLILCAKPLFLVLYSERWLDSVPYFQVLCLAGIPFCLQGVNNQAIAAVGKSDVMFKWTVLKRSVSIFTMFCTMYLFGIKGLLIGLVFTTWFAYFVNISLVSKFIGYKWNRQLADILPVLAFATIDFIITYILSSFLDMPLFIDAIFRLVSFTGIYVFWSLAFKPECYISFKSVAKPLFAKGLGKINNLR